MTIEELETNILRLDPESRARLAGKLLDSLETLSEEELARIWGDEATRRDSEFEHNPNIERSSEDVYRDARARLR